MMMLIQWVCAEVGIGSSRRFESNFASQVIGLAKRKLHSARNDFTTIPLLLFPCAAIIATAAMYQHQVISADPLTNQVVSCAIYMFAFVPVPGLLAEFLVRWVGGWVGG